MQNRINSLYVKIMYFKKKYLLLRFQKRLGNLVDFSKIKKIKKNIAREISINKKYV